MLRRSVTLVVLLLVLEITSNRRQIVNAQADDDVFFNDDTYYDHDAVVGNSRPLPLTNDNNNSGGGGGGGIQFDDGLPFVVDDACTDAQRRWHGVCTPASRCPSVLDEFKRHGRKPTVCSYAPSELIVCCPTPAQQQQQQPQFLRDRLLASERPNRNTDTPTAAASGRISQQKCEEYSRLATHTGSFTLLSIITHVDSVSIPTCAYPTGLIVGGIKTKVGEFPHMAVIGWTEPTGEVNWNCGGSLISDSFVLTAGHCAAVRGVAPDIVRLGEQNLARTDDKASPVDYGVTEVIAHPNYKTSSHYFDIAVVKLDRPVGFNKMIRPACLWQNEDVNSTRAVATGWGRVEFSGGKSDDLLKVPLDIVENGLCSTMYGPSKRLRSGLNGDQLCAGFVNGGKDTCQGDSGGPLQVLTPRNQCIFHIIGVTSFGRACAARNSAGVYTRVSSYLDWLESVVWT